MKTMTALKEFFWKIVRQINFGPLVLWVHPKSALVQDGWYRSFRENRAVDRHGKPIPWITYSSIRFIEKRLHSGLRIFEYGSGNSTLWFSQRVSEVISVEHDSLWAEKIAARLPKNCKLIVRDLMRGYVEEILNHGTFDIIIIDGRRRLECSRACLGSLSEDGVILWDDSNMSDFMEGFAELSRLGFRELNFYGMVPSIFISSQTSILYRDKNCLGI